ncbi:peptide/nickel transport system permease protein [Catenulispora sp. GAS73]|uniref:ABC transporter permease n=1 Tax=Catenulispora sp. GAS73 TaxID=3156269 RepID=UPI003519AF87
MFGFILRRGLGAALILFAVSAVTFFLFFALPSDPARLSCGKTCTPQTLAAIRHNLGVDRPLFDQYWQFLHGIFDGRHFGATWCAAPCLGYSFVNHKSVTSTLADRFPATLSLAVGASVLILTVGVGLGVIAALRRGQALDKRLTAIALVGSSMQVYFVGIVARYLLVDEFSVLPQPGYSPITSDPGKWFGGMILPWSTLAVVSAATYVRFTRSSMIEAEAQEYVRTARAQGLPPRVVHLRYAWRGAMTLVLTQFGLDLGLFLGSAVITETTFNIHGIAQLAVSSVTDLDLPMITGTVLVAAAFIVLCNVAVDLCYAFIDPRVRL